MARADRIEATPRDRMVGTAVLLDWLARYDGDSWQQRWLAPVLTTPLAVGRRR